MLPVQVNASNSRSSILSDAVSVEICPAAPDGPLSPRLAAATPTSLQVVWYTPARNNAPGSPTYQLQMSPSTSLSYEVSDLQPFTVYELRLVATDGFGSTHSAWTPLMTAEDMRLVMRSKCYGRKTRCLNNELRGLILLSLLVTDVYGVVARCTLAGLAL